MGFREECRLIGAAIDAENRAIFVETAALAHESITLGSPLTGAPGQPVDTGALRSSWHLEIDESEARITTNLSYAPIIEDGFRSSYDPSGDTPPRPRNTGGGVRKHIKSTVGGHQSVGLTVAGIDRLIEEAGRRIGAAE